MRSLVLVARTPEFARDALTSLAEGSRGLGRPRKAGLAPATEARLVASLRG